MFINPQQAQFHVRNAFNQTGPLFRWNKPNSWIPNPCLTVTWYTVKWRTIHMSKYSSLLQPTYIQMHTLMDSWGFHSSATLDALAGMSPSRRMHVVHNSRKKCYRYVVVRAWCITFFVLSFFFVAVKVLVSHLYTTYLKTGCRHYWVCSSWIRSNRTPHSQNWCLELWSCPLWTHYGSTPFGP